MFRPSTTRSFAALALVGLTALAGCGSSNSGTSTAPTGSSTTVMSTTVTSTTSPNASTGASTATTASSSPATASSSSTAVTLQVTIAHGKVTPNDQTVTAHKGQQVRIVVTSDRATEVHVHGYDLHIEAVAGTVTKTFTADQVGTFEIETHDPAFTVYELQVD